MFSDGDDNQGLVLGVMFGLIALVIGLVIGVSIYKTRMPRLAAPAAVVAPAVGPGAFVTGPALVQPVRPAAPAAGVAVEIAGVKIYFDADQSALPASATQPLSSLAQQAVSGRSLLITGHLANGPDAARNEQLTRQRVLNVRDALAALGVSPQQMLLAIPAAAGGLSDADSRRVDVRVQ